MDRPSMLHLRTAALHITPMNCTCCVLLPILTLSLLPLLLSRSARSLSSLVHLPPASPEIRHCGGSGASPYALLLQALALIPLSHYHTALFLLVVIYLYNALDFHLLHDLCHGFRGERINLTFSPTSELCHSIVSKCRTLHGRYQATPWLCSPHLQMLYMILLRSAPAVNYRRELIRVSDGGTIALDWLAGAQENNEFCKEDKTPIAIVIPGLSSDSSCKYIRRIAFRISQRGWDVCVCNHAGLGGVQVTSGRFYHGGWTNDVREIIKRIHNLFPCAPLYAVGTSVGANILVKYLGEEGDDAQVLGAAAVSCPWDFLLFDRFINRKILQMFYNKFLTISLQIYALMHERRFSNHIDWEAVRKACTFREFDRNLTIHFGKFETVDTYYRQCGSIGYVKNVKVLLLCINALDDPVCPKDAIPWDECKANKNIILAFTRRGSHVSHFEGMTGSSVWWARAVDEFLGVLHSSNIIQKIEAKQGFL